MERDKKPVVYHTFLILLINLLNFSSAIYAKKIACVGNSITYGYGLNSPYLESYPSQLQNIVGSKDSILNFGISNSTVLKRGDSPYWKQKTLEEARKSKPDAVVIELGTNDAKLYNWYVRPNEFPMDYKSLIDTFQLVESNPSIWICLAPFANNTEWNILDTSITLRINPDILKVGIEEGVNIIDLHSDFSDMSWYSSDSVHPNKAGSAELAKIIHKHLFRDTLKIIQSTNILKAPSGFDYNWYLNGKLLEDRNTDTLVISQTGSYQALVKIESQSDTRILTKKIIVKDLENPSSILPFEFAPKISISRENVQLDFKHSTILQFEFITPQGRQIFNSQIQIKPGRNSIPIPSQHGPLILHIRTPQFQKTIFLNAPSFNSQKSYSS